MDQRITIGVLVILISIKNASQGILIPIISEIYKSFNFVLITCALQFILVFGTIYLAINKRFKKPANFGTIIASGFFLALATLCMLYAANPKRTPIMLQVILISLLLMFSYFLRKKFINRVIVYDLRYIIISAILIGISILLCSIPIATHFTTHNVIWIPLFLIGVISLSAYNVAQERYLTEDASFGNKITLLFYSKLFEFGMIIGLSWLELFIGYEDNPIQVFKDSAIKFVTDFRAFLLLQGFILAYLFAFFLATYLNSISTNYNMFTIIIANPLIIIFFTIFKQFNTGIVYSLWIIIPAILLNIIGIVTWVKGERKMVESATPGTIQEKSELKPLLHRESV